jgi:RNA polymerase sigma-70 factor (ECF subfamily)
MNPFAMPISRRALFDALFRKHHQELLAFANRRLGSVTAQDIVQDAYAQLMQVSDLVAIENPRAYLYRVVGNLAAKGAAIDRLRTSWVDPEDALATLRSDLPSADAAADAAIQLSKCVAALDELPKLQRHAFLLNRIDGLTHAEVATTLGLSKRTVERYVAKALEHCLARLGQDSR